LRVRDVEVTGEFIGLGQLLQLAGIVDTGGEAKNLVGTLTVVVNGEPEGRRGRKLRPGDVVELPHAESLRVVAVPDRPRDS
jgi:ribosome-associated protein